MLFTVKGTPNLSSKIWYALKTFCQNPSDIAFVFSGENFDEYVSSVNCLLSLLPSCKDKIELCIWSGDTSKRAQAVANLYRRLKGKHYFHILDASTISDTFPANHAYGDLSLNIKRGGVYRRTQLLNKLQTMGYERVGFVEENAQYAVRGSVVDIFPLNSDTPIRLFFEDEKLESIKYFEIDTQHTSNFLDSISIPPKNYGENLKPFYDFLDEKCRVFSETMIDADIKRDYYFFGNSDDSGEAENFNAVCNLNFNSDVKILVKELFRLKKEKYQTCFFCINMSEANRMAALLTDYSAGGLLQIQIGNLSQGFIHSPSKTAVISATEYFKRNFTHMPHMQKGGKKYFKWTDLKIGDYVVHEDYGVGKYLGIKKIYYRGADGIKKEDSDCLYLEYARGDTLFVPLDDFTKIQKYISSEGKAPRLSYMDTKTWKEMKQRVGEEVREMARNILRMEAERAAFKTKALVYGGSVEDDFAEAFAYEETSDQKKAIKDVLDEMSGTVPMNRLIAGDVGFGKTEVAMRAAMRTVLNGAQTALIAPTTILADQHYHSFLRRFSGFPVRIKSLSRFVSRKEQKQTLKELSAGKVDIIIGTHRLLQKDIKFNNLGLMTVDEEHRFGVKDKDKIKSAAKGVHCLLMSATPIPRTLYQSLSSLKTMSVIETPPVGRQAIATYVRPFSEKDAAAAVAYELERGGQVYYVHNRVQTIESRKTYLQKLMPGLRIAIIHGQQNSETVSVTMRDFLDKKYDVLMATSIIESGIDIPNVNTLIVENAHEMGLAQLYQLRGRIGRETRKAFCYLYYPSWIKPKKHITVPADIQIPTISEDAARRLNALEEFTSLGSGLRLAMRDLEIRGAGDLLGIKQHGFINSVGLEMYIKLLNGEINQLKGANKYSSGPDPKLEIAVSAFIPQEYMSDEMERLNFYKKILNAEFKQLDGIYADLEDLSGPAPEQVKNLFETVRIKKQLAILGVREVIQNDDTLDIFFSKGFQVNERHIRAWQNQFAENLSFLPSKLGDGVRIKLVISPLELIKQFIGVCSDKIRSV